MVSLAPTFRVQEEIEIPVESPYEGGIDGVKGGNVRAMRKDEFGRVCCLTVGDGFSRNKWHRQKPSILCRGRRRWGDFRSKECGTSKGPCERT